MSVICYLNLHDYYHLNYASLLIWIMFKCLSPQSWLDISDPFLTYRAVPTKREFQAQTTEPTPILIPDF